MLAIVDLWVKRMDKGVNGEPLESPNSSRIPNSPLIQQLCNLYNLAKRTVKLDVGALWERGGGGGGGH